MFFVASKIFWFFAQPVNLATFLIAVVAVAAAFGRRKVAFAGASAAFFILALSIWTTLGALLLHPLEDRFKRPRQLPDRIAGIVVLGGSFEGGVNRVRGGYELNASGDRFVEAAALARRFPGAKVLVTGGSGALLLDGEADADTAPRLLVALGVAPERLLLERESRNTDENAVFSMRQAQPKPGETWLLVTSAFHMPRAMGLFRRVGFAVLPWPADYRTSGQEGLGLAEDNPLDSLMSTSVAIREWIGLVAYWLSGRIDSMLPAPE